MDQSDVLFQLATKLAYGMPMLLTFLIGLVLLLRVPPSNGRLLGMIGLALLMVAHMVTLGFNLLPILMIAQGNYDGMSRISVLLGIGHGIATLLRLVGTSLLIAALYRALRRLPPDHAAPH